MYRFYQIYFVLLLFCCILFFTTCKKYPEDKFYSLKRPEKRVIGEWKIIEYNFNDNSVIAELNAKIKTYDVRDLILKVVGKSGKTEGYCEFNPYYTSSHQGFPIDKTERSIFHFSYNHFANIDLGDSIKKLAFLSPLSLQGANYTNWDIRNLYKDKMHLQLKTDSGNYDIYFEK